MSRWVVKVEEHSIAFDPSPWVNYLGDIYMGQKGFCYQVVLDLEHVDKWGQVVTTQRNKEPPYEEILELKLLNTLKVTHIPMDNPNIALYKREEKEKK